MVLMVLWSTSHTAHAMPGHALTALVSLGLRLQVHWSQLQLTHEALLDHGYMHELLTSGHKCCPLFQAFDL
jgi:hypothetical protein